MPNWTKPFRQVKRALMGALVILAMLGGTARAGEWPLVLPVENFGIIPYGQGMAFFMGTWEQSVRPQGGDMTVTETTIEYRDMVPIFGYRYRVIYEALNYHLVVATRLEPTRAKYPTEFMIFTAQSLGEPVTKRTELRLHYCGLGMWGTREAFDWPVEKLLQTLNTSLCMSQIDIDETVNFGWGDNRYHRADVTW